MRRRGVLVGMFAVFLSRSSVLLGLVVIAVVVVMSSLQVMMRCSLMLSRSRMMVLA